MAEIINPKLPKRFKERWLKALRSGEYEQGDSRLHVKILDDGEWTDLYCCLGVACKIQHSRKKVAENGRDSYPEHDNFPKVPEILCTPKRKLYRYVRPRSRWSNQPIYSILAGMNDSGRSFKQIAKWIEKNL